uniref:Peroxidase n=1 Tax=Ananas comosus var. bracteatus TaxID=296719 RepID=A0A6V7PBR8_ANACO|nr:unnamed protein product [Ananas comosus var. bracteatus]
MGSRSYLLIFSSSLLFSIGIRTLASPTTSTLDVGFYRYSCPAAEAIVRQTVSQAVTQDSGLAAGLIRMHFHDCFVRVSVCIFTFLFSPYFSAYMHACNLTSNQVGLRCFGAAGLDPGNRAEKDSVVNNPSLRGFPVIDAAKAAVEAACRRTVSCADILAFAARDAAFLAGGIDYPVPAGRRDGRVSRKSEVLPNLPRPSFGARQLTANFAKKGLAVDDMVTLSGAHSIGRSHCSSFDSRLYNFTAGRPQDPSMDPRFAANLKTRCPTLTTPGSSDATDPTVPLDAVSPTTLDNQYYKNVVAHRGVLTSDQTLVASPVTAGLVRFYAAEREAWAAKFAAAMAKMGSIEVLTGEEGEIRENCRVVNC